MIRATKTCSFTDLTKMENKESRLSPFNILSFSTVGYNSYNLISHKNILKLVNCKSLLSHVLWSYTSWYILQTFFSVPLFLLKTRLTWLTLADNLRNIGQPISTLTLAARGILDNQFQLNHQQPDLGSQFQLKH